MKLVTVISTVVTAAVVCGVPLVIVAFVGIGFFGAWRARRKAMAYALAAQPPAPPPAPPAARWAAGCWGLWCGAEDSATWNRERAVQSLSAWYGADSAEALNGVVDGLLSGQTGNVAWDVVRAVDLLRIGVAAGYLSEEACARKVVALAPALRRTYDSWEALGAGFEAGMNAWQDSRGITDPQERGRVQRNLPVLRLGVWPKIAWDAAL